VTGARAQRLLLGVCCLLGPALVGMGATALSSPQLMLWARDTLYRPFGYAALAGSTVIAVLSAVAGVLAQRLQRGTPGRLRALLVGYGFALCAAGLAGAIGMILQIAPQLPNGALVTLYEAILLSPSSARAVLVACLGFSAAAALVAVCATLSAWFLLNVRLRSTLFWLVDAVLLGLCIWLSLTYGFKPKGPEQLLGSSARLMVSLLLGIRFSIRMLPHVLNTIELLNFQTLVAARHLRAKKSGFLAAIGFLSILAVSVSSCALTTTLSVMGGFRQDLKSKILGNNAHIVVDRNQGRISQASEPSRLIRRVPGVRGVSAYVAGEVMISSSSNLTGAVLRGIDPAHIAEVSDLPTIIKDGSLEFLSHPEKLTRLPSARLGFGSSTRFAPKVTRGNDDDVVKPLDGKRLSEQLDEALRKQDMADAGNEDDDEQARAAPTRATERTLPGIIVGRELARSLRLYLGDEVNIVTPLGALGPSGPMPKSRPFRVAGIFYSGMYEYDMKFAYVTLEAAQSFLGTGAELTGVEVTVHEPDRAQDIALAIAAKLPEKTLRVRGWQELNRNLFGALALEKLAMFIALGIAILVASFCIVGTLTLMVQEKGREVAVLKAMGAADKAIVAIFVMEGTLIGVFGSLLGLALGYAVCFAMENFGVRLNPEVYYIDRLPVHIDPAEFLAVGLSAVVVCLLVTIYPAQLASRLRPVDALRFE